MKRIPLMMVMFLFAGALNACVGLPSLDNMMYPVEDSAPDYARGSKDSPAAKGRAPLDVPPELRKEIEVPMPDKVATDAARGGMRISAEERKAIAGKAVSLDARVYDQNAARVFSAIVDAMTALNMPVESVDSPSGTITSDWIRPNANSPNAYVAAAMNIFGGGPVRTRHRFIVRVFRTGDNKTQLQIRTLGQQFLNQHWVNKPIKRKVSMDLFSAVEERIGQQITGDVTESLPTGDDAGASLPTGDDTAESLPTGNDAEVSRQADMPASDEAKKTSEHHQGAWVVNLVSFDSAIAAEHELKRLQGLDIHAENIKAKVRGKTWYRVRVPGFASAKEANRQREILANRLDIKDTWISKR